MIWLPFCGTVRLGPKYDLPFLLTCAATGPSAKKSLLLSPLVALTHIVGGPILPLAYKEAEKE
jgi:hypothetical protein